MDYQDLVKKFSLEGQTAVITGRQALKRAGHGACQTGADIVW
jgi:hypothetical protein